MQLSKEPDSVGWGCIPYRTLWFLQQRVGIYNPHTKRATITGSSNTISTITKESKLCINFSYKPNNLNGLQFYSCNFIFFVLSGVSLLEENVLYLFKTEFRKPFDNTVLVLPTPMVRYSSSHYLIS